jgi:hypothetical protein
MEGMTDSDLFATAPGALATLADKKLVTPRAGMITKRLAEALFDARLGRQDCGSTEAVRTPLTCPDQQPCCACYGPDPETGRLLPPGAAVGLRAALFIGESCTQRAMKTFQSGGTNDAVGAIVPALEALLGGRKHHPSGGLSLLDLPDHRPESLEALAMAAVETLGGELDPVHPRVAIRHIVEAVGQAQRPLDHAGRVGDPLIDASDRGRLGVLIDAVGQREQVAVSSPWRERLVHGTAVPGVSAVEVGR